MDQESVYFLQSDQIMTRKIIRKITRIQAGVEKNLLLKKKAFSQTLRKIKSLRKRKSRRKIKNLKEKSPVLIPNQTPQTHLKMKHQNVSNDKMRKLKNC